MAIVIDQTSLGTGVNAGGTNATFNTSGAVASGGFIVLGFSWVGTESITSITGGGLTYTVDNQANSGDAKTAVISAQAAAGLAAGTTITVTLTGVDDCLSLGGMSFTGVKTSSPVDVTDDRNSPGGTAWATNSMSIAAGSVIVAAEHSTFISGLPTSTATSPSIESFDTGIADCTGLTAAYRIEASAGSYTVAGTWSSAPGETVGAAVAYLEETVAPADVVVAWITA